MAYDVELANRLRDQLEGTPTEEKRMFGGLAFLVNGNMAVAASSKGGLMVRCAPEETDAHYAAGATPCERRYNPTWLSAWVEPTGVMWSVVTSSPSITSARAPSSRAGCSPGST